MKASTEKPLSSVEVLSTDYTTKAEIRPGDIVKVQTGVGYQWVRVLHIFKDEIICEELVDINTRNGHTIECVFRPSAET